MYMYHIYVEKGKINHRRHQHHHHRTDYTYENYSYLKN